MRALSIFGVGACLLASTALCGATPAAAQLRPLLDPPASADAAKQGVEVFLLNESSAAQPALGPAELEVMARDGMHLRLVAAPDGEGPVAPGAFARVHYRLAAAAPTSAPVAVAAVAPGATEQPNRTSRGTASGFLDRLHPYAPTYGVIGAGDAGAKLQLSFDFRVLGRDDGPRLDFAYTQTMFWAIDRPSGPVRATGYSPELFVDVPVGANGVIGGGYRHDSNGGGVTNSIDVNRVLVRAARAFDLGHGWRLDVTPMAWFYFGNQGIAPDLDRYWGYTSLGVSLGQRDGLKLAVTARGNPGTGKGSAEAFLSYPLVRISDTLPRIYLFGQAYTGYGEALIDYNKRATHVRAGIAFTR
ncbi:phospholipase A [Sphingomonas sp. RT2P30]|uniref:phospholipase A n=1 Tax=Parasphingomonas halimpatiens TaxID=3096162 RepID=UPI002FCB46B9